MASDTGHSRFRACTVGNSSRGERQEKTPSSRLEQRPYVLLTRNISVAGAIEYQPYSYYPAPYCGPIYMTWLPCVVQFGFN
jgi:hypothetical protein